MEIAIIAHDDKKAEMMGFIQSHRSLLQRGGDAQIAGRVAEGKTNMVLFFKDPLGRHPHEPDINMLLRVCDVHNVPLATNEASAQLLLKAILKQS